jgi:hypothetical protein
MEIVVAAHGADSPQGAHSAEVSIACANRHVAVEKCTLRQVADLRALSFHPTARTLRLLSCSRSVGSPPPSCLTPKHAKTCDLLRNMLKRVIKASIELNCEQTDCRLVAWSLLELQPPD